MPSGFSLYSARSAVSLSTVSAPREAAFASRQFDGISDRHRTSRRAITECDRFGGIITSQTKECTWRRFAKGLTNQPYSVHEGRRQGGLQVAHTQVNRAGIKWKTVPSGSSKP